MGCGGAIVACLALSAVAVIHKEKGCGRTMMVPKGLRLGNPDMVIDGGGDRN
jgi:hypothetical protein